MPLSPLLGEGLHALAEGILTNTPLERAKRSLAMAQIQNQQVMMPLQNKLAMAQTQFGLKNLEMMQQGGLDPTKYKIGPNGMAVPLSPKESLDVQEAILKLKKAKGDDAVRTGTGGYNVDLSTLPPIGGGSSPTPVGAKPLPAPPQGGMGTFQNGFQPQASNEADTPPETYYA